MVRTSTYKNTKVRRLCIVGHVGRLDGLGNPILAMKYDINDRFRGGVAGAVEVTAHQSVTVLRTLLVTQLSRGELSVVSAPGLLFHCSHRPSRY